MVNLLQICEPGETPLPHADSVAIGIDLGTTHSVVAIASNGEAEPIHDAFGRAIQPSIVQYAHGAVVVGHEARRAYGEGEEGVIASVKRLMGKSAADIADVGGNAVYATMAEKNGLVRLRVDGRELTPTEISAEILKHLRDMAADALGRKVSKAVITVPAYFDDAARAATKDAARMAGLEVLRLINEPTAAALAYGLDQKTEGTIAIYDLGGGTFDISILKLQAGVFQVLATAGDTALGGDDIDRAIAEEMLARVGGEQQSLSPAELAELLSLCRAAKEALSSTPSTQLEWRGTMLALDVAALELLIQPLLRRSLSCCEAALADAGLSAAEITDVVLVGGSTRIPLVKRAVAALFGKKPYDSLDPDLVVALGAALQAEALTKGADHLLLDVIALSLGLETMGGIVEKIIHRNTPIPAAFSQEFTTYQDGQTAMIIHVLQGEREKVVDCRSLAKFTLRGIPPMVAGAAKVRITFTIDADGLLTVAAEELTTGTRQQVEVNPSYGLAFEEIERMVSAGMEHARSDIMERLLIEARVEAERTVREVESAMAADKALLKPGEEMMIQGQIARLKTVIAGENRERIDHEAHQLSALVGGFAERRMNHAIAGALAGRNVDEVE
jgi:molecular chaperone HscA